MYAYYLICVLPLVNIFINYDVDNNIDVYNNN